MDSTNDAAISPGLMRPWEWDFNNQYDPKFDLGMGDWILDDEIVDLAVDEVDKENHSTSSVCAPEPFAKRKRLSLSSKQKAASSRFAAPVTSVALEKATEGLKPRNTEISTRWALKNFNLWAENRAKLVPDEPVPEDLLQCRDHAKVCKFLCLFVLETRKEDGSSYPPATLRSLLSGVNRELQRNGAPFSILDKHDLRFRELSNTLDVVSSTLHREGVGAERKSASVITIEHETLFWEMGLLGFSSPRILQKSVFFYLGLHFALRGIQEQYDLVPQQVSRFPPDTTVYDSSVYYQYTEFISKNNQHRFKDVNMQSKVTRAYAQVDTERCVVKLLDLYFEKLPPNSKHLYMRPLERVPKGTKPWFTKQRVGVNTLKEMVPKLSVESKCGVRYTNHSLRATATTRMFSNGVPEKVIAEKTGHRSLKALRFYERTPPEMEKAMGCCNC